MAHSISVSRPYPGSFEIRQERAWRALGLGLSMVLAASAVLAHGTLLEPPSRVYQCRFNDNPENPSDPACAAAIAFAGDNQFLYDWAGIRQANADGNHQDVIPDGQLCGGGDSFYGGLDLVRDDWRSVPIAADPLGNFEFVYWASVPHATDDMLFFVTPEGWDPTQPLTWEDLDFVDDPGNPNDPVDPFCRLTSVTQVDYPEDPMVNDVYRMTCPLPARTGRHVIFHVWQRSDSPEAFYGCIDVDFGEAGGVFDDDFESGDTSAWEP